MTSPRSLASGAGAALAVLLWTSAVRADEGPPPPPLLDDPAEQDRAPAVVPSDPSSAPPELDPSHQGDPAQKKAPKKPVKKKVAAPQGNEDKRQAPATDEPAGFDTRRAISAPTLWSAGACLGSDVVSAGLITGGFTAALCGLSTTGAGGSMGLLCTGIGTMACGGALLPLAPFLAIGAGVLAAMVNGQPVTSVLLGAAPGVAMDVLGLVLLAGLFLPQPAGTVILLAAVGLMLAAGPVTVAGIAVALGAAAGGIQEAPSGEGASAHPRDEASDGRLSAMAY